MKLHSEDTALANTLPRERDEHLELDEEASPSGNRFEVKLAARIILVGNPTSTPVVNALFIFLYFFFFFAIGIGGGIESAKGKVSCSTHEGAEGSGRVVETREKRKGESALELKGRSRR